MFDVRAFYGVRARYMEKVNEQLDDVIQMCENIVNSVQSKAILTLSKNPSLVPDSGMNPTHLHVLRNKKIQIAISDDPDNPSFCAHAYYYNDIGGVEEIFKFDLTIAVFDNPSEAIDDLASKLIEDIRSGIYNRLEFLEAERTKLVGGLDIGEVVV